MTQQTGLVSRFRFPVPDREDLMFMHIIRFFVSNVRVDAKGEKARYEVDSRSHIIISGLFTIRLSTFATASLSTAISCSIVFSHCVVIPRSSAQRDVTRIRDAMTRRFVS